MTSEEREALKKELKAEILAEVLTEIRRDLDGLEKNMNEYVRKLTARDTEIEDRVNGYYAIAQGVPHL